MFVSESTGRPKEEQERFLRTNSIPRMGNAAAFVCKHREKK